MSYYRSDPSAGRAGGRELLVAPGEQLPIQADRKGILTPKPGRSLVGGCVRWKRGPLPKA